MNYWTQSKNNIYVAAHRGWSKVYPENTLLAFKKAIELDVDQLETDVRATKDGELICIHDATVDRTTDGSGAVNDMTFGEIRALNAGVIRGEEFNEKIPAFTELMDLVRDHPTMTLNVELKEYPTEGREAFAYEVCDRILKIIDDYGYTDRVVLNSWSGKLLEYIYGKYGRKYRIHSYYPISHLGKKLTLDPAEYSYCCCMFRDFHEQFNIASDYAFKRMESLGVQPWAGTAVKDEESADMAISRGAYLITCNNPDEVLNILRMKGKHK